MIASKMLHCLIFSFLLRSTIYADDSVMDQEESDVPMSSSAHKNWSQVCRGCGIKRVKNKGSKG